MQPGVGTTSTDAILFQQDRKLEQREEMREKTHTCWKVTVLNLIRTIYRSKGKGVSMKPGAWDSHQLV